MRLLTTLLVILLTAAPLMAEASVESCMSDTAASNQQSTSTLYRQQNPAALNVFINGNEIHVSDVTDGSTLYIYSITGARVGSFTIREGKVVLNSNLAKGIYIIRVNNRSAKITIR